MTAHLAVFPLPPIVGLIAAPVAVTVFLGVDGGVEHPTAAAADKFADSVSSKPPLSILPTSILSCLPGDINVAKD